MVTVARQSVQSPRSSSTRLPVNVYAYSARALRGSPPVSNAYVVSPRDTSHFRSAVRTFDDGRFNRVKTITPGPTIRISKNFGGARELMTIPRWCCTHSGSDRVSLQVR